MHGIISARIGKNGVPIVHIDDDHRLIELARCGDLAALGTLYNRHVDRIYQYARYRTGDDQAAEDITADVFLRAIESIADYKDQGAPFAAWLYRIAHARVVDYWRKSKRHQTAPLEDPLLQEELSSQDDDIDIDFLQHRSLTEALQLLTDDQQNVIVLKFMQGLSNAETALVLGKTEGAIKALQWRALEALARILNK
jgi:RNA polymerase sigma-70 factor, ECF subfamily